MADTDDMADTEAMAETGETEGHRSPTGPPSGSAARTSPSRSPSPRSTGSTSRAKGYDVEILTPAGFRTEAIDGITNGELDLIIDYIGGSLTALAPDEGSSADPDEIVAIIDPRTPRSAPPSSTTPRPSTVTPWSCAATSKATPSPTWPVPTPSSAPRLSASSGRSASSATPIPRSTASSSPKTTTIEFGPLLGEALAAEEVDAVVWNTTAPQIAEQGFKVLEDDKGLHPAQNIAPIMATEVLDAYGDQLATDLNTLSAAITTEDLVAWNIATDINFRESDEVATEWLTAEGLI